MDPYKIVTLILLIIFHVYWILKSYYYIKYYPKSNNLHLNFSICLINKLGFKNVSNLFSFLPYTYYYTKNEKDNTYIKYLNLGNRILYINWFILLLFIMITISFR